MSKKPINSTPKPTSVIVQDGMTTSGVTVPRPPKK